LKLYTKKYLCAGGSGGRCGDPFIMKFKKEKKGRSNVQSERNIKKE
jgi:hypothetical protein